MRRIYLLAALLASQVAMAQQELSGRVVAAGTKIPLEGATVVVLPSRETTTTDERGQFYFKSFDTAARLLVSSIGFDSRLVNYAEIANEREVALQSSPTVQLSEVRIEAAGNNQYRPVSQLDIRMRGVTNSQEVLRMVPGLFIGQHAGGGKAEQIFLRGFDIDHGTDISIGVDGMPVNMVSHAHGQGYADLHFLIPELIAAVNFKKGPYDAAKGNFTTSGFVDFRTANVLPNSSLKVEGGMFNTFRAVGMFDLLSTVMKSKGQSAYIASEYMYTKGYFDHPQDFNRVNLFGKYNGALNRRNNLNLSVSYFNSGWDASGQIPDRAVASGMIGYFGAIDPGEGGTTSRANVNAQLTTTLKSGAYIKNQLYYARYHFGLYSNFTFYKEDVVNGDQIRQREQRHLAGYNGSYHKTWYAGTTQLRTEFGLGVRADRTKNSELSRTKDRSVLLLPMMLGNIAETNISAYASETIVFSPKWNLNAGLRFDHFENRYTDHLNNGLEQSADAFIVSPKISLAYQANEKLQIYLSTGKGFHSNDTRVVVPQNGLDVLPPAYGADLGVVLKPVKNVLINAALWYLWLDQEFVYVGDEGIVEPGGKSRRYGVDLSVRYQPVGWLYADVDFNYAHARAVDAPKGEDYLPLAPRITSIGGLTAKTNQGINASLRYRYMGNRPANEDNSTVAKGYYIMDAFLNYARKQYEVGFTVQNIWNRKWKETQFDTESRLFNEPQSVSEIHFTPGTPLAAKISFMYKW